MSIIDMVLIAPAQARQTLQQLLRIPHFQVLHVQPHFHPFADQPARHRVVVPLDVDQAAAVHARRHSFARFQTPRRQRTQLRQLFRQAIAPARVELVQLPIQKKFVVRPAREIPAAAQHQGLIDGLFEAIMPLLDVAILIAMPRLNLLRRHAAMRHQAFVTLRELFLIRGVVHGQAHPIGAMPLGHGAQLPQRVLQPFAQALETLREADRRRLPVRVGQHKVVNQMVEALLLDRHVELVHRREVRRAEPAGFMHLREEHFLGRPPESAPTLQVPLQRPQLAVQEAARIAPPQLAEDRLRLQSGIAVEQFENLVPNRLEGIASRRPVVWLGDFAGQFTQIAVFACRLLIHVGEPRCPNDRSVIQKETKQIANLLVGDHRKPPCAKSLRSVYAVS